MRKNDNIMLRKIFLADFIDMLCELYDNGADYVDLIGRLSGRRDEIAIQVREEYLREDLTEDYLNKLI